jgi:predicted transcriptional regulator
MYLLNNTTIHPQKICDAAGVSLRYYYRLKHGTMKDPSVHKIQRIFDYLTGAI